MYNGSSLLELADVEDINYPSGSGLEDTEAVESASSPICAKKIAASTDAVVENTDAPSQMDNGPCSPVWRTKRRLASTHVVAEGMHSMATKAMSSMFQNVAQKQSSDQIF